MNRLSFGESVSLAGTINISSLTLQHRLQDVARAMFSATSPHQSPEDAARVICSATSPQMGTQNAVYAVCTYIDEILQQKVLTNLPSNGGTRADRQIDRQTDRHTDRVQ